MPTKKLSSLTGQSLAKIEKVNRTKKILRAIEKVSGRIFLPKRTRECSLRHLIAVWMIEEKRN